MNAEVDVRVTAACRGSALALLPLPDLATLPEPKARGTQCVWCNTTISTESAVDLGARRITLRGNPITVFPRACTICMRAAHKNHPQMCEQCTDDAAQCDTGRTLRRLVLEHVR